MMAPVSPPDPARTVKLMRYLSSLGYGTRREVEQRFRQGQISDAGDRELSPELRLGPGALAHEDIRVEGEPLDPPAGLVILVHKPAGLVCSTEDRNPLVFDLLPPRFLRRTPSISSVGRLDKDSTGLLLLTDDGALLHRITSPKSHLPKCYRASLAEPVAASVADSFGAGTLLLAGETKPLAPARLEVLSDREVRVTITEGRYHQIRRMFAAVGNHVTALHRETLGPVTLHGLDVGDWRLLSGGERERLDEALRDARASGESPRAP